MGIKTHRCLVCMKKPNLSMHHLLEHINLDIDKAKIRTHQYIKLNTRAKEFQQVNPEGPYNSQKHQASTISSIDKYLSWNRHRVWSSTLRCAMRKESKVANRDWVDNQACSLLQYINVIANLFIMENYFNKLRWKNYLNEKSSSMF